MKPIALAGAITTGLVFTMPAAHAVDLDKVPNIVQHVVPVHHTIRILVCSDDDDDDGVGCSYVRVPRGAYGYHDDDDDGVRQRTHRRHYHDNDDDDDD